MIAELQPQLRHARIVVERQQRRVDRAGGVEVDGEAGVPGGGHEQRVRSRRHCRVKRRAAQLLPVDEDGGARGVAGHLQVALRTRAQPRLGGGEPLAQERAEAGAVEKQGRRVRRRALHRRVVARLRGHQQQLGEQPRHPRVAAPRKGAALRLRHRRPRSGEPRGHEGRVRLGQRRVGAASGRHFLGGRADERQCLAVDQLHRRAAGL